jgi:hypothetical protein
MNRRAFVAGLGSALVVPIAAKAQQPGKVQCTGSVR